MRILTISDTVERKLYHLKVKEHVKDIDLILSCGDLPLYYLEFLVSTFNVPLYYVFGNHHATPMLTASGEEITTPLGCVNIDARVLNFRGLLIGGFEGCMRYNNGPMQYSEFEMWEKSVRMLPHLWFNRLRYKRYVDLIITHAPPAGIHDQPDLCHQGFTTFLRVIERYQPRYLIHGHTHRYSQLDDWKTQYRNTTIINTCGYRILEIDEPEIAQIS